MPPASHQSRKTEEPAAEPGTSPVPGKPLSQVEAEAPPDAATAKAAQAEYDSRVPAGMYP